MKEFRLAKCHVDGHTDWYAIFADGSEKKRIMEDDTGRYFNVDNELNTKEAGRLRARLFTGRVKDAIDTIKAGNGDVLVHENGVFGFTFEKVRYYIDREVGDSLRAKTLDGWKDAKFCYVIKFGSNNSMSDPKMLGADGRMDFLGENPMLFDTEEDATNYFSSVVAEATAVINNAGTSDNFDKEIDSLMDKYGTFSMIVDIMADIVIENEDGTLGVVPDGKLKNMYYRIDQYVDNIKERIA
jgi:hypothetical protein